MECAFPQGTASVLKDHQHLFLMTLADRNLLPLSDKVAWLEFVQLAQQRARAHFGRKTKLNDASEHGQGLVFLFSLPLLLRRCLLDPGNVNNLVLGQPCPARCAARNTTGLSLAQLTTP
jgi:hypothetical protein